MDLSKYSDDEKGRIVQSIGRDITLDLGLAQAPSDRESTTIFQPLDTSSKPMLAPSLGLLPPEVASDICLMLDIPSAISFSQVNRHARDTIARIREFRRLGTHAAGCIWVLLQTGLAPHIDAPSLHSALTAKNCSFCGRLCDVLLLATAQRACFLCVNNGKLQPMHLVSLAKRTGMSPSAIRETVPVLRSIPGVYRDDSRTGKGKRRTHYLVASQHCDEVARVAETAPPEKSPYSQTPRLMSATHLPYLNPDTEELERGVTCYGCLNSGLLGGEWDPTRDEDEFRAVLYYRDDFLLHLQSCYGAEWFWNNQNSGLWRIIKGNGVFLPDD